MKSQIPLVMHVVYSFNIGGLENGLVNLINRMPVERFGHVVVALTDSAPMFRRRVTRTDVDFVDLRKPPGHGFKIYPQLHRLFRQYRPAIVHTRNLAALEAVVPARAAGVPVRVHGEHGWDVSDPEGTRRKFQILRRFYSPFVSRYVALSAHIESYLVDRVGIDPRRVERICNGVDTRHFFSAPSAGRAAYPGAPFEDPHCVVVGTVGRLQAVKDQLTLVRAFALARHQGPAADRLRLVIVGDGPMRPAIEDEIRRAGIGNVVWLAGERHDVADLMRSFDLFVLPSKAEGISNTILEAMACGLPVIATTVGGNAELVAEGETGSLVPAGNSSELARTLMCYAADAAMRQRYGVAGRDRVERGFSVDTMHRRYTDMYDRLLAARRNFQKD